jgi:uncharacterized protein with GYD domain
MKTFVMLTNLTDEGRKTLKESPERIKLVNKTVEAMGAKIIAQYALLGVHDFITILQAEDDNVILKVATELGARGTVQTTTLPAFPIDEFIQDIIS